MMGMILNGKGPDGKNGQKGNGQEVIQKPKQKETLSEPIVKPGEVKIELQYTYQGKTVNEDMVVPRSLIYATQDPGESGLAPLEAMRAIADFHDKVLKPEFVSLSIDGGTAIPASILSAQIQRAYSVHAVVAATDSTISARLHLENPEVQKMLRAIAASLLGVTEENVRAVNAEEEIVWVSHTINILTQTPKLTLETTRVLCDFGSHKDYKNVTLLSNVSLEQAREEAERRIARMPEVRTNLEKTFDKISELRGNPLDKAERDAVVEHVNATFISDPEKRLIVTP